MINAGIRMQILKVMIFMITGGLLLRSSHLLPPIVIGVLYCGIGASLVGAGVLFLYKFVVAVSSKSNYTDER